MTNGLDPSSILGDLYENLRAEVALGQLSFDEIVDYYIDDIVEDGLEHYVPGGAESLPTSDPEAQREWLLDVLDAEFAAHLQRQETWPETLDSDRLAHAFTELDANGIIARERCGFSTSDALSLLKTELDADPDARGFVYYHQQDALRLRPYLGFDSRAGSVDPDSRVAIGREIAAALERHGLEVEWDGDPDQKILGPSLLRRREGELAEHPGRGG